MIDRKGVDPCGKGAWEEFGRIEGKEAIIRI